jgi:hypothetical protein
MAPLHEANLTRCRLSELVVARARSALEKGGNGLPRTSRSETCGRRVLRRAGTERVDGVKRVVDRRGSTVCNFVESGAPASFPLAPAGSSRGLRLYGPPLGALMLQARST